MPAWDVERADAGGDRAVPGHRGVRLEAGLSSCAVLLKCDWRMVAAMFNTLLALNRSLKPEADPQNRLLHIAQYAL